MQAKNRKLTYRSISYGKPIKVIFTTRIIEEEKKTDLEYLRNNFNEGKTSISIQYRRKYADGFKQVAMDMIPADDYSAENQTLFLYVKNIDM